jgi:hypothetical protein
MSEFEESSEFEGYSYEEENLDRGDYSESEDYPESEDEYSVEGVSVLMCPEHNNYFLCQTRPAAYHRCAVGCDSTEWFFGKYHAALNIDYEFCHMKDEFKSWELVFDHTLFVPIDENEKDREQSRTRFLRAFFMHQNVVLFDKARQSHPSLEK